MGSKLPETSRFLPAPPKNMQSKNAILYRFMAAALRTIGVQVPDLSHSALRPRKLRCPVLLEAFWEVPPSRWPVGRLGIPKGPLYNHAHGAQTAPYAASEVVILS